MERNLVTKTEEFSGLGVLAEVSGSKVLVGNDKLMEKNHISYQKCDDVGTILYVAIDNTYAGLIVIADKIKEDAKQAIEGLKKHHVSKTVMLTGDKKQVGKKVASDLGIDLVYAELLPTDKAEKFEEIKKEKSKKATICFVGDGMNDSPVLSLSDVGIAMGSLGADSAIEAADVVIMTDEPSKIVDAISLSKKTMRYC